MAKDPKDGSGSNGGSQSGRKIEGGRLGNDSQIPSRKIEKVTDYVPPPKPIEKDKK